MALVALVVLAGGAAAMALLGVWDVSATVTDADRLRLDRIKTGLTVAAGLAAGVTLLMALRRQSLSERAQRFAESDALEQRTTALYVAAADQLGSEKAAVRLAGLYALERLGQDNPKLRQTVFEVWCAYLRMPYVPPIEVLHRNEKASPARPADDAPAPDAKEEGERRQELEVRLTAQRLLAAHLRHRDDGLSVDHYWLTDRHLRLSVDLTGAVLVDFTLIACSLDRLDLRNTQFHGLASLSGAQFHGFANLREAQFHANADLREAQLHAQADLGEAQFHGDAHLGGAQFHADAYLGGIQFHADADLGGAQFHGIAILGGAQFHGDANLREAQFHGDAYLGGTEFHADASLGEAQFHADADLSGAQFHGFAILGGAQFHGFANLREAQFHGDADLSGAQFHHRGALPKTIDLVGAYASNLLVLPRGWALSSPRAEGELLAIVRANENTTPAGSEEKPD